MIVIRCSECQKPLFYLSTPIDTKKFWNKINGVDENNISCRQCKKDGWSVGRVERNMIEWICEHGIGHWDDPHGCDRCCQREDYPGRVKNEKKRRKSN